MLDEAKVDPTLLRVVLQELSGPHNHTVQTASSSGGEGGSEGYAHRTLKGLPAPAPRTGELLPLHDAPSCITMLYTLIMCVACSA